MGFPEDAEAAATMPIPGPGTPDEARRKLDAMPIDALAGLFCSLQYLTMREAVDENHDAMRYFDRLPHEAPERAFALILAVLRSEAHKAVKMELNTRLFGALLYAHGDAVIGEIDYLLGELSKSGHPTTLIVTTDHGRGSRFAGHGGIAPESSRVWLVAAGAGIAARGYVHAPTQRRLADIAPTLRRLIGLPDDTSPGAGSVLEELLASGRSPYRPIVRDDG